jgi:hypothetical protein
LPFFGDHLGTCAQLRDRLIGLTIAAETLDHCDGSAAVPGTDVVLDHLDDRLPTLLGTLGQDGDRIAQNRHATEAMHGVVVLAQCDQRLADLSVWMVSERLSQEHERSIPVQFDDQSGGPTQDFGLGPRVGFAGPEHDEAIGDFGAHCVGQIFTQLGIRFADVLCVR